MRALGFKRDSLFAIVASAAIGLFGAVQDSQARDAGALGGGGGGEFRSNCNGGDTLIGVNVMQGSALDRIAPICIPVNDRGDWTGNAYEAPAAGGSGGGYQKLACDPSWAVTELRVFMDGNKMVHHVAITCVHIATGDQVVISPKGTGGQSIGDVNFECNSDELGTGLYGRSGALVDQVGLQCEKHPFYAKQAADAKAAKAKAKADAEAQQKEREAEIADQSIVTGRTAEECQASFNRCQARCDREAMAAGGPGSVAGINIKNACMTGQCVPWMQQCVANAAQAAGVGGGNPPPAGGGGNTVTFNAEMTGYDKPEGNDKCYLNPGDTATVIGSDANDAKWKHMQGKSGGCDGQDFWVYDEGQFK